MDIQQQMDKIAGVYTPIDLGVTGFMQEVYGDLWICSKYKRGRLREVYFTHEDFNLILETDAPALWLQGYGVQSPVVEEVCWCKDHKTSTMRLFVPKGVVLWVTHYSVGVTIGYRKSSGA